MARLYLITDETLGLEANLKLFTTEFLAGCGVFQLRFDNLSDREFHQAALEFSRRCHEAGVPFIVNDRVDIALAAGADGVHLGADDLPVEVVRRLVGGELLIGRTVRNRQQAVDAQRDGASYLAAGPCFGTQTKPTLEPIGVGAVKEITAACELPVCAIGGITPDKLALVLDAHPAYTAVISSVTRSDDPAKAKQKLVIMLSIDEHNLQPRRLEKRGGTGES